MRHALVKTILIDHITNLISREYKIPLNEARNAFYLSETLELLEDDSTGLYGESPLYIFSIFEQENAIKKLITN